MAASLLGTNALYLWTDIPFPFSLACVALFALTVATIVTLMTRPEDPATLQAFYRRIRPPGVWGPVAVACGAPARSLPIAALRDVAMATAGVYGLLLGTGWWLFGARLSGGLAVGVGLVLLALSVRAAATSRSRAARPRT